MGLVLALSFTYALCSATYIMSATMTLISHAETLSFSSGIMLIFIRVFMCQNTHRQEIYGALLATFSIFLMLSDSEAEKVGGDGLSIYGDVFGFL